MGTTKVKIAPKIIKLILLNLLFFRHHQIFSHENKINHHKLFRLNHETFYIVWSSMVCAS